MTIGDDIAPAGIDVVGIFALNCERVLIDDVDITITQGSGTVQGLYFDMTIQSSNTNWLNTFSVISMFFSMVP